MPIRIDADRLRGKTARMELDDTQRASREQFARQSRNYGKSHILADTSDIASALGSLAEGGGRRALDVATGGGHTAVFLAEHGWQVTATDLTPEMLERARELAEARGVALETAMHAAEVFPFSDATFSLVTCRVAAHHFSDPAAFVGEAARVLVNGGAFLLIDGSVPDGEPEAAEWIHRIEKLRDPSHGRFLAPEQWRNLCSQAGLTVETCSTTPFLQPDLQWYFETAGTSESNRSAVLELIQTAPDPARRAFGLANENGRITWWWPRLSLLAKKR